MSVIDDKASADLNKISGVVIGIVTNNQDPEGLGRLKLKFPWRDSADESSWARLAVPMAGNQMGTYFIPEVGDEVLVAFEHGDISMPFVIGSLWNGQDKPPESNSNGKNNKRLIKSRSGHQLIFNDESGKETVEIHTKMGHQIVLDDSSGSEKIEVKDKTGSNSILIDSSQNSITIKSQMKVSIQAQMIELKADANMNIESSGALTLKGSVVKIN
jgi:uncharacterized protein involved in type VI secretion and phage assembly